MTLLLLRHGESEGNVARVVQGQLSHYALTPLGREQAEAAGRRLAGLEIDALYSSHLRRARETADIVAAHSGHEVIELPDLQEYGFGEAQGLTWDEVRARFDVVGRAWGRGRIPGEEGSAVFRERVARQIGELAERHRAGTAVAVLHGGVLGAAVGRICGLGDTEYAQIYTANCGITEVGVAQDGRLTLRSLNDTCHLRALGGPQTEPWLSEA